MKQPQHLPQRVKSTVPLIVALVILLLVSIRTAGIFLGHSRAWGIDVLGSLDGLWALLLTAPLLLLLIPGLNAWLDRRNENYRRNDGVAFWTLSLVFLLCAIFYPMTTFFYGDGSSIVPEVFKLGQEAAYSSEILNNLRSAPLAGSAIVFIARTTPEILHALGLPIPEISTFPFHVLSIMMLLVAIAGLWRIPPRDQRVPLLMMVFGCAGTLLFFGYVEFYTPVYVSTLLYLLFALRALDGGPVWPAVLAFFAACGAHYSTIALLPTLVYLLAFSSRRAPPKWLTAKVLVIGCTALFVAGVAVYFLSGLWKQDGRIVISAVAMTSSAGEQGYSLISLAHVSDLIQLPLLMAPASVLYLVLRTRRRHVNTEPSPALQFLGLALFFYSTFLVFANASFGWARDWDLAAPLGLLLSLLAYRMIKRDYPEQRGPVSALALASLIAVAPWIVVNVSPSSSVARFEDIVELDSEKMYADYALSGFEALRKHYLHIGDFENELRIEKRMIERLGYPEHYRLFLTSVVYQSENNPAQFTPHVQWMLDRLLHDAGRLKQRHAASDYAMSLQAIDSLAAAAVYQSYFRQVHQTLMPQIRRLEEAYHLAVAALIVRGMDAFTAEDYQLAERSLGEAARAGFSTAKLAALRCSALLMLARDTEAEMVYKHASTEYPDDAELRFLMGYGYLMRHDPRGRTLLQEALTLSPSGPLREQIVDLLAKLGESPQR